MIKNFLNKILDADEFQSNLGNKAKVFGEDAFFDEIYLEEIEKIEYKSFLILVYQFKFEKRFIKLWR